MGNIANLVLMYNGTVCLHLGTDLFSGCFWVVLHISDMELPSD